MVSIIEIAPPEEGRKVSVLGEEIEVFAVRNRAWATLARRFPDLKRTIAGISVSIEDQKISGMETAPAIIAAGLGQLGDEKTEAAIDRLPLDAQMALLRAVMEQSYPPDPTKGEEDSPTTILTDSAPEASITSP